MTPSVEFKFNLPHFRTEKISCHIFCPRKQHGQLIEYFQFLTNCSGKNLIMLYWANIVSIKVTQTFKNLPIVNSNTKHDKS
jgi:hypothetical protein